MSTQAPVVLTIPQNGTNQAKKDRISKLFPKRTILILSSTQLICAALSAILQVSNHEITYIFFKKYILSKSYIANIVCKS